MGNYLYRKRNINDSGSRQGIWGKSGRKFTVVAGLSTRGARRLSEGLRFYWLHFDVERVNESLPQAFPLEIEQHCVVRDPQYVTALFRQFLSEQEKLQRSVAQEIITYRADARRLETAVL